MKKKFLALALITTFVTGVIAPVVQAAEYHQTCTCTVTAYVPEETITASFFVRVPAEADYDYTITL